MNATAIASNDVKLFGEMTNLLKERNEDWKKVFHKMMKEKTDENAGFLIKVATLLIEYCELPHAIQALCIAKADTQLLQIALPRKDKEQRTALLALVSMDRHQSVHDTLVPGLIQFMIPQVRTEQDARLVCNSYAFMNMKDELVEYARELKRRKSEWAHIASQLAGLE